MQMHAEMMRAMSDIMLKYSNKLETSPRSDTNFLPARILNLILIRNKS